MNISEMTTAWINLDEATENARRMEDLFARIGLKNTHRIPAVKIEPDEPHPDPMERCWLGLGESHAKALKYIRDKLPAIVFEDDVDVTAWYENNELPPFPEGADAIYLGVSVGNSRTKAIDIGGGYAKIENMFSLHAVLYLTERYVDAALEIQKEATHKWKRNCDVGTSVIMGNYNVITPHSPWFYQKASPDALHNWEPLTNRPLNIIPAIYANGPVGH
jgi:hypothetical protein